MPRFVILRHTLPSHSRRASHWDVMLEWNNRLSTWAIEALPFDAQEIPATALADHRLDYLDYEGPVSNDRGTVTRWDGGTFRWLERSRDRLRLEIHGQHLRGTIELYRVDDHPAWRLVYYRGAD